MSELRKLFEKEYEYGIMGSRNQQEELDSAIDYEKMQNDMYIKWLEQRVAKKGKQIIDELPAELRSVKKLIVVAKELSIKRGKLKERVRVIEMIRKELKRGHTIAAMTVLQELINKIMAEVK